MYVYIYIYLFCFLDQVEMIKKRVILCKPVSDLWNEKHEEMIWQFVEDPYINLLVAYYDPISGLILEHRMPSHSSGHLCYFIKGTQTKEVTSDNFLKVVQYGSVKDTDIMASHLRLMTGIYAPMFFENTSWPDSILFSFLTKTFLVWRRKNKNLHFKLFYWQF